MLFGMKFGPFVCNLKRMIEQASAPLSVLSSSQLGSPKENRHQVLTFDLFLCTSFSTSSQTSGILETDESVHEDSPTDSLAYLKPSIQWA